MSDLHLGTLIQPCVYSRLLVLWRVTFPDNYSLNQFDDQNHFQSGWLRHA